MARISAETCVSGLPNACSYTAVGVLGYRVVFLIRAPADEAATIAILDLILTRVDG